MQASCIWPWRPHWAISSRRSGSRSIGAVALNQFLLSILTRTSGFLAGQAHYVAWYSDS